MHSVDIVSRDDGQSGSPSATFPQKLFSMLLLNIDQGEIIHWLPHGLAFKVVDNEKFSEGVLPKYFKREFNKYSHTRFSLSFKSE
jgi:HSF-type DNA-binding